MNLVELQKKLIAAARADAPVDRVPYAFEKRITALLGSRVAAQRLDQWVHGLWRAAISFTVLAVACGAFALLTPSTSDANGDLSQNLDNTLLASVDQSDQAQ